ncbi:MAG: tRNA glutamyl-Q(34) synthetase GluQRS [Burkholderiales bacterium]
MNAALTNDTRPIYRGRFAPSPTGPLHFGSLVAAVGSYLDARSHGGQWLVRIEDIDTPRVIPGAADDILRTLEQLGMHWDDAVMVQSQRGAAYRAAFEKLRARGVLYPCACTRREIADSALLGAVHGIDGFVYPGICRDGLPEGRAPRATRVRTNGVPITFDDAIQGAITQNLERDVGDFVVWRADGLFAYQLAVVVDDAEQGITDVVRGADLLDSTPRQIYLQQLLDLPAPRYAHLPVAVNARGEKLSKQTLAKPIDTTQPAREIVRALRFLGQPVEAEWQDAALRDLWPWAITHWDRCRIPAQRTIHPADSSAHR